MIGFGGQGIFLLLLAVLADCQRRELSLVPLPISFSPFRVREWIIEDAPSTSPFIIPDRVERIEGIGETRPVLAMRTPPTAHPLNRETSSLPSSTSLHSNEQHITSLSQHSFPKSGSLPSLPVSHFPSMDQVFPQPESLHEDSSPLSDSPPFRWPIRGSNRPIPVKSALPVTNSKLEFLPDHKKFPLPQPILPHVPQNSSSSPFRLSTAQSKSTALWTTAQESSGARAGPGRRVLPSRFPIPISLPTSQQNEASTPSSSALLPLSTGLHILARWILANSGRKRHLRQARQRRALVVSSSPHSTVFPNLAVTTDIPTSIFQSTVGDPPKLLLPVFAPRPPPIRVPLESEEVSPGFSDPQAALLPFHGHLTSPPRSRVSDSRQRMMVEETPLPREFIRRNPLLGDTDGTGEKWRRPSDRWSMSLFCPIGTAMPTLFIADNVIREYSSHFNKRLACECGDGFHEAFSSPSSLASSPVPRSASLVVGRFSCAFPGNLCLHTRGGRRLRSTGWYGRVYPAVLSTVSDSPSENGLTEFATGYTFLTEDGSHFEDENTGLPFKATAGVLNLIESSHLLVAISCDSCVHSLQCM